MRFSKSYHSNVLNLWTHDVDGEYRIAADWYIEDGKLIEFESYAGDVPETPQLLCEAYRFLEKEHEKN